MKLNLWTKIENFLFGKKKETKSNIVTKHYEPEPVVKKPKGKKSQRKNNRKSTNGRKIQVIKIGSKIKFIKHQI